MKMKLPMPGRAGIPIRKRLKLIIITVIIAACATGIIFYITRVDRKAALRAQYKGDRFMQDHNYLEAIEAYSRAIRNDPANPYARYNRGTAYMNYQKYDLAIKDFNLSLKLNPENTACYLNRGYSYFMSGDYEKAVQDAGEVISRNPENPVAYYNRGRAYYHWGKRAEALADFRKAYGLGAKHAKGLIDELSGRKR